MKIFKLYMYKRISVTVSNHKTFKMNDLEEIILEILHSLLPLRPL